ncbi:hypothetical protein ACQUY5_31780 [Bacillus cereus]|uniref:hypothetical protein n=1 Tax=Bacillus cereus TaxID=1396 RepID=UPI003D186BCB
MERQCGVKDCTNKLFARGYCRKHHKQVETEGKLLPLQTIRKTCSVEACKSHPSTKGLCGKHYMQTLRHGKVVS